MGMPSIEIERRYFFSYAAADAKHVKALKRILRWERLPLPPIAFEPMFDEAVGVLFELTEGAQACTDGDALTRHLELAIATLQRIVRRRGGGPRSGPRLAGHSENSD